MRKNQGSHYVQIKEQNKHKDNLQTQCDMFVEKTMDGLERDFTMSVIFLYWSGLVLIS